MTNWKHSLAFAQYRDLPPYGVEIEETRARFFRSPELWERRYYWSDMGMPEGLAYEIIVFERVARENGFDVRTTRIPGLDYST